MSPLGCCRGPEPLARLTRLHVVSTAADACIAVALAGTLFFNLSTGAARSQLSFYLLLTLAPFAVVTPLLAPTVDRLARAPMRAIAATGWARAGLALAIAACAARPVLLPASFLILVFGRAYAVTKRATIPALIGRGPTLMAANAQLSRAGTTAAAAGGVTATALLHLGTSTLALELAAALHVAAAVLAPRISAPSACATDGASEDGARPRLTLVPPLAAMAALRIATGLLVFTAAFALREAGAPGIAYALLAVSVPVGSLAGTFASPRLRRAQADERAILGGCLAASAVVVALAAFGGVIGITVALPVVALASSVGRHAYDSILQRTAGARARNRVFARCEAVLQVAWVSGALLPTAVTLPTPLAPVLAAGILATFAIPITVRVSARPAASPAPTPVPARAAA